MKKWINEDGNMVFDISKDFDKFVNHPNIKRLLIELSKT